MGGSILAVSNLKNIMLVFVFFYFMLTDKLKRENYAQYRLNYLLILSFAIGGAVRAWHTALASRIALPDKSARSG